MTRLRLLLIGLVSVGFALVPFSESIPDCLKENGSPVCTQTDNQQVPRITTDAAGGAFITWMDHRGSAYDIYAQRVDSVGSALWNADGIAIRVGPSTQDYPEIVPDMTGGCIITWQEWDDSTSYDIYAQRVNAQGQLLWSPRGVSVCTAPGNQWEPQITVDGLGGAIIAWRDERTGFENADIEAQRISASGEVLWLTDGVPVCQASGRQYGPRLAADGTGGACVTWVDLRSAVRQVCAQRIDSQGNAMWMQNGVPICEGSDTEPYPGLVSDGDNGAIIGWWGDGIRVQRVAGSGAILWPMNGTPVCSTSCGFGKPLLISDGTGGAVVVWQDGRDDDGSIYAQRVNASGSRLWNSGGVLVCRATPLSTPVLYPDIVSDGDEGAVVSWEDYRNGKLDIYAQRLDKTGNVKWSPNGLPICRSPEHQIRPKSVSDGLGGAIITWLDYRNSGLGEYGDIYAQRVRANGVFEPHPENSFVEWVDTLCSRARVIVCPEGDGSALHVSVRDWLDQPVQDAVVNVAFEGSCDLYVCPPVSGLTDSSGEVSLHIHGGLNVLGDPSCCVVRTVVTCPCETIPWEGTRAPIDTANWISPDVDADYEVGAQDEDLLVGVDWLSDACRTDFNCDGIVDSLDYFLFGAHYSHVTGIPASATKSRYRICESYPNPFNPLCTIRYEMPTAGRLSLRVFDLNGSLLRTIVDTWREPGIYSEVWDSRADDGTALPSGIYFYRLEAGSFVAARKMVLLR